MRPAERLLKLLHRVQSPGQGQWSASCPTSTHKHGDRSRCLSIKELSDGRLLLKCFAGCDNEDVLSAVGLSFSDLYPDKRESDHGQPARWPARDLLIVISDEAMVVHIAAEQLASGQALRPEDRERLTLAGNRIRTAMKVGGVYGRR